MLKYDIFIIIYFSTIKKQFPRDKLDCQITYPALRNPHTQILMPLMRRESFETSKRHLINVGGQTITMLSPPPYELWRPPTTGIQLETPYRFKKRDWIRVYDSHWVQSIGATSVSPFSVSLQHASPLHTEDATVPAAPPGRHRASHMVRALHGTAESSRWSEIYPLRWLNEKRFAMLKPFVH